MRKTEKRQAKVIREDLKVWMGWKAFIRCCLIGLLLGRLLRVWTWSDSIYWEGFEEENKGGGRESLLNLPLCSLLEAEKEEYCWCLLLKIEAIYSNIGQIMLSFSSYRQTNSRKIIVIHILLFTSNY